MHSQLLNELRTINPEIPEGSTPEQAWHTIRPKGQPIRESFWWVLSHSLRFAKSEQRQKKVAEFIAGWRQRAATWPPRNIVTKPVFQPAPNQ